MTIHDLKPHVVATQGYDPDHLTRLCRALASWFVRRDNSFYDVEDPGHKRSRVDIEHTALLRFADEFPEIPLSAPLVAAVWKRTIQTRHTNVAETILPWNGRTVCRPGNAQRIVVERGVATLNAWSEPAYCRLGVTAQQSENLLANHLTDVHEVGWGARIRSLMEVSKGNAARSDGLGQRVGREGRRPTAILLQGGEWNGILFHGHHLDWVRQGRLIHVIVQALEEV